MARTGDRNPYIRVVGADCCQGLVSLVSCAELVIEFMGEGEGGTGKCEGKERGVGERNYSKGGNDNNR